MNTELTASLIREITLKQRIQMFFQQFFLRTRAKQKRLKQIKLFSKVSIPNRTHSALLCNSLQQDISIKYNSHL